MNLKDQIAQTAALLIRVCNQPYPTLGVDLDGCCDESRFFSILTHVWPSSVFVITMRSNRSQAESDLQRYDIRYTELVLVDSFEAKSEVIARRGISFFIDDQPEMLKGVQSNVGVLLFRNGGNFDFNDQRWMFSQQTAKLIK
jgi:hypothetical protein